MQPLPERAVPSLASQLTDAQRAVIWGEVRNLDSTNGRLVTRWTVITGAPGSGKTTLVRALEKRGRKTIRDTAREVLEERIRLGVTNPRSKEAYLDIQNEILSRMVHVAEVTSPDEHVFLDYAPPDNLAFLSLAGLPWTAFHVWAACRYRYKRVCLLDLPPPQLASEQDAIRAETFEQRLLVDRQLTEIYACLNVRVERIPYVPLEGRISLVVGTDSSVP